MCFPNGLRNESRPLNAAEETNPKSDKTEFPKIQFRIQTWLQPRRPDATVNAIQREPVTYIRAREDLQCAEPVDIDHEAAFAAS